MSTTNISHFVHTLRSLIQDLHTRANLNKNHQAFYPESTIELKTFSETSTPIPTEMSPFSQLTTLGGNGYGNGVGNGDGDG